MTQEQMILKHLQDYGTITTWEAFTDYGITRLSDKIFTLRNKGYNIENENMSALNRYKKKVHFTKYHLK